HFSESRQSPKTLEEILYGTDRQSHRRTRDHFDPSERYRRVQKDIAILFRFQPHADVSRKPEKVSAGTIGLSFDALEYPIVWLGGVSHEESVTLLVTHYDNSSSIDFKSTILGILSWHERSTKAYELLTKVLNGPDAEDLRKKAALFLGEFDDNVTLELLQQAAESDRSSAVAENAVLGISRMESESAVDVLVKLAKNSKRDGVRKKAVHSLSRFASEKAVSTLQDIVYNDKDVELQKQALYALSRIKKDDPIPQLISLARSHTNSEVRKYAIYLLGQSKDERALDALIDLVKK
ncbi:MAG TPA: HEAT repeat domain-containing protein, partial [Bacteroidota bacterium]